MKKQQEVLPVIQRFRQRFLAPWIQERQGYIYLPKKQLEDFITEEWNKLVDEGE